MLCIDESCGNELMKGKQIEKSENNVGMREHLSTTTTTTEATIHLNQPNDLTFWWY